MQRVGVRRGARALVLIGSIVGLVAAGFAAEASVGGAPIQIGANALNVNPNDHIDATVGEDALPGQVLVVSVATGTFNTSPPGCHDDATGAPPPNVYHVVVDKNAGSGRVFVCVSQPLTRLLSGGVNKVTATYPGFSGLSVISVVDVGFTSGFTGEQASSSGSNPPVSSGPITLFGPRLLIGVVANSNVSTFTPTPPDWSTVGTATGGSGAGKRTLTVITQNVASPGPWAATGSLSGSGFWQAGILAIAPPI